MRYAKHRILLVFTNKASAWPDRKSPKYMGSVRIYVDSPVAAIKRALE